MWWFDPSANYVLIVTFVGDTVSDIMKTIMKYHWEECKFFWLCYFFKTYDEKNEVIFLHVFIISYCSLLCPAIRSKDSYGPSVAK